mgnify:CR=1 FL=1
MVVAVVNPLPRVLVSMPIPKPQAAIAPSPHSDSNTINVNFWEDQYNTLLLTVLQKDYTGRLPELASHVKYLLDLKADPSLAKSDGTTPLHLMTVSTGASTNATC